MTPIAACLAFFSLIATAPGASAPLATDAINKVSVIHLAVSVQGTAPAYEAEAMSLLDGMTAGGEHAVNRFMLEDGRVRQCEAEYIKALAVIRAVGTGGV